MREVGTNSEVIAWFFKNDRDHGRNGTESLYFDGDTMYSYGKHFPLCHRHKGGQYIINGDRYSNTTSKHQSDTLQHARAKDHITLSLSAIDASGINFRSMTIIDTFQDDHQYKRFETDEEYKAYQPEMLPGYTIQRNKWSTGGTVTLHRPATALIKAEYNRPLWDRDKGSYSETGTAYFLSGMDEGSYFISQLPTRCKTIEQAFQAMKPKKVKDLEKTGTKIVRQGEWFFHKILNGKEAKRMYKSMEPFFIMPRVDNTSNPHTATRGGMKNRQVLVSGRISHPEHSTLKLSLSANPEIWQGTQNTAKGSWSASGTVD